METNDLRVSSIHEAGHIVGALACRVPYVYGKLIRHNDGEVIGEMIVGGKVWSSPKGKLHSAIVGFSGVVAEVLAQDIDTSVEMIRELIDRDEVEPSPTDWDSINRIHRTWHFRALCESARVLSLRWADVILVADALIWEYRWHKKNGHKGNRDDTNDRSVFSEDILRYMRSGSNGRLPRTGMIPRV